MGQHFFRLLGFSIDAIIVITLIYQSWRIITIFHQGRDKRVLCVNLILLIIGFCIGSYIFYQNIL